MVNHVILNFGCLLFIGLSLIIMRLLRDLEKKEARGLEKASSSNVIRFCISNCI